MKRVLIGTPSHDGRIDVWFANSLLSTIKMSAKYGYDVHAIYTSYDSLIQRARNSLFKIAVQENYDFLFFIDSDMEWEPEHFFNILNRPEPVVGGVAVKKTDKYEGYAVKIIEKQLKKSQDGKLIEVDGIGTGFMKLSNFAFKKLWEMSETYYANNEENRMVCNVIVENGELISEDYVICKKWKSLGYKLWIDPSETISHMGNKKFRGDFKTYLHKNGYK